MKLSQGVRRRERQHAFQDLPFTGGFNNCPAVILGTAKPYQLNAEIQNRDVSRDGSR